MKLSDSSRTYVHVPVPCVGKGSINIHMYFEVNHVNYIFEKPSLDYMNARFRDKQLSDRSIFNKSKAIR